MLFFLGRDLEMIVDRVLIWADGPQLCAGTDLTGQRWLVFRSRSDREGSLWLCSPITEKALREVETGRAAPRDALRHSSTGLVEVVAHAQGRVLPERCLRGGDIPEPLLPPADLRVTALVERTTPAGPQQPTVRPVAPHAASSTPALPAGPLKPHQPVGTHPALCAAA
jgi:hypothetical protein